MLWIHYLADVSHFAECRENLTFYSAMVRERKRYPEFVSGIVSPPKVNQFFGLVGPIITPSFSEIG